ncbi:phosphoenolpyruvate--protein phosphotransferase [Bartonella sp. DGB2]|uniref:phosphoenolpyruvate--protein phosphotransferase n=1 Tax=Bartonella sp. DGB2 TaxID=3388426 RepID=UPI00398FF671
MRESHSDLRVMLKWLRGFMAEAIDPQLRLDRIVTKIAQNMIAEVCSFYVLRSDGFLELYATHGLNPNSVHLAQLRLGQGLVGVIAATARPLNLTDAQRHPAFAYLPETGEELYSSFLGVPILRAGRTLGVLVLQNRSQRGYSDDEVEALETIAMVLAEMVATGDLPRLSTSLPDIDIRRAFTLSGQPLNEGIGLGHVVIHEPRIVVTHLFNEDSQAESDKLAKALESLRVSIDEMLARSDVALEGEHREVLEAYRMVAHDRGWVRRLQEAIYNGLTAEAAVEKVQADTRAQMIHLKDSYLRERLSDFDDLANRLLHLLMGRTREAIASSLPKDAILVARSMGAAELLDYPRSHIRGLVLEDGSPTSHVVIVARAMAVPVVGQTKGAISLCKNADAIIVDGDGGKVYLRPLADIEEAYSEKARFRARRQKFYRDQRDIPAVTKDGVPITLLMNAGLLVDLPHLKESGAQGVGLFRTELQFMIASTFPRAQQQEKLYRNAYKEVGQAPITFRTLDIGGDKIPAYFRSKGREENPALGWRAIRLTLDKPGFMRIQLRALLKASGGRELRLMLPMVTQVEEIYQVRQLISREMAYLERFNHSVPSRLKLGAMIEVPALLFQLDALMQCVDFVSVGSNDLFQFFMAVDRTNSDMEGRFDLLSVAFLRALRHIVEAGMRHQTPVTLCGEMAGSPLFALALLGLGYQRISMAPSAIGPVKSMILELDLKALQQGLLEQLLRPDVLNLRTWLLAFVNQHNIQL